MSTMASQLTGVSMVCSIVCSGAGQRKHQSSAPLAFVRGIHRWPVDSPHKGPVTRNVSIWWRHHEMLLFIEPVTRNPKTVKLILQILRQMEDVDCSRLRLDLLRYTCSHVKIKVSLQGFSEWLAAWWQPIRSHVRKVLLPDMDRRMGISLFSRPLKLYRLCPQNAHLYVISDVKVRFIVVGGEVARSVVVPEGPTRGLTVIVALRPGPDSSSFILLLLVMSEGWWNDDGLGA